MKPDPYASHIAPLASALMAFPTGPVLELGAGHYSTPLMHALCAGRELVTMETDARWLAPFMGLRSRFHALTTSDDELLSREWGVVFVDCAPAALRGRLLKKLTHCGVVVMHDAEAGHYGLAEALPLYRNALMSRRLKPWTIALSNHTLAPLEGSALWEPL
jgi:predicted O-methyltransferase YrrM